MKQEASGNRQIEVKRNAASGMQFASSPVTSYRSQVTNCSSRITTHQSPLTIHAFLIDIWRLETSATPWKHTARVHSNRHSKEAPPIIIFAAANVVSAPRRVLASPFSPLGVPSPWRNQRVHRVSAGGRDRDIDPHVQLGFCSPRYFHTKCLFGQQRNRKTEIRGSADGASAPGHFHLSIFRFRFGRFER